MKKIAILLISFIITANSYAQEQNNCINEVDTHPDVIPTQNHLDALPRVPGNTSTPDERFINAWKWWMDHDDPNYQYNIPIRDMKMSPSEIYGDFMAPINSNVYSDHYDYLSENEGGIMFPEDGWELLAQNRGWYPDNDSEVDWTQNTEVRAVPYILLYNKFSGVARVFVRYGQNTHPDASINFADISIFHPNEEKMSGMLRLADGLDRTLDQESIIQRVTVRVPSPGTAQLWFSADFQLAFDPCVCQHRSDILLHFKFFSSSEITLTGRTMTVEGELTEESYMGLGDIHEFLAGVSEDGNTAESGYLIYKRQEHLINDYLRLYEEYKKKLDDVNKHNKKVERNLAILKIAQTVLAAGVAGVSGMPAYTSALHFIPSLKAKDKDGIFGKDAQKEFFKLLDKVLNETSNLVVKGNFSNFIKEDEPSKPTSPTVSFSEFSSSGNLKSGTGNFPSSRIKTPGSLYSNTPTANRPGEYPIYDEALGVFALLEKPKIKVSNTIIENIEEIENVNLNQIACGFDEGARFKVYNISRERNIQVSLEDDLKYFFNPALNIESYSIETSFDIRGGFKVPSNTVDVNGVDSYEYAIVSNLPQNNVNIESVQFEVDEELAFKPSLEAPYVNFEDLRYNTLLIDINAKRNLASSFSFKTTFSHPHRFSNWYGNINNVNCSAINDYINSPYNSYDGMKEILDDKVLYYEQGDIYLKFLINVTYEGEKSDGSPHEYTYMFTYKVDDIDYLDEPIYPNLPGSAGDFTQYPENLLINAENFNGSQIDGCKLNGNSYLCKAYNDIGLSGTFTVANNFEVIVEAGNEINVLPEAIIPPEMTLQVVPVFDYSNPMPPVKSDYVQKFCRGQLDHNRYRANSRPGMPTAEGDSVLVAEAQEETFAFNIFPNPTNGRTTASVTLDESGTGELFITDISGRKLGVVLNNEMMRAGENTYQLPTETLNSGIYLIHLYVNGEHHVKRLVKN